MSLDVNLLFFAEPFKACLFFACIRAMSSRMMLELTKVCYSRTQKMLFLPTN
jgi:hypothetical protein